MTLECRSRSFSRMHMMVVIVCATQIFIKLQLIVQINLDFLPMCHFHTQWGVPFPWDSLLYVHTKYELPAYGSGYMVHAAQNYVKLQWHVQIKIPTEFPTIAQVLIPLCRSFCRAQLSIPRSLHTKYAWHVYNSGGITCDTNILACLTDNSFNCSKPWCSAPHVCRT